jgi:hypothetical protein
MAAGEDSIRLRPIRLGLIGTGLAVELLHWPALRRLGRGDRTTERGDRAPTVLRDETAQLVERINDAWTVSLHARFALDRHGKALIGSPHSLLVTAVMAC